MSQPNRQLGKYQILGPLGSGSFAETFRAHDTVLDREIALKVLRPALMADRDFVAQFQREARTLARLRHPNILTIYDVDTISGRLCLALELAEGGSLADLLARSGRLGWAEALALLGPICAALDYMHGQGVLHRDLKPSNILLRGDGVPLLADFGLSRTAGQSMTAASASQGMLGTPAYIAPEVWDGQPASAATDIYALACVAYELLAGTRLFPAEALTQAVQAHARGPQLPASWPPGVPAGVAAVLRKALSPRPEDRYQSAGAFFAALRGLAPAKSTAAAPARLGMWLAAGGTLLVLLMALGLLAAGRLGGGALVVVTVTPAPSPSATPKPTSASGPAHTPLVGSPTIVTPILPTPASTLPPDLVPALVKVPTGPFLMGSSADDPQAQDNEKPQKSLSLPDYWIGKTEVTNAQFRPFVEGDGYTNQAYWTAAGWAWRQDQKRTQPSYWNDKTLNASDQPVVGVTWYEAVAYCRWLSAQTGREFRLPTEAEWEKAARGTDGQIYPWGNTWAAGRANTKEAGVNTTQPVGKYPAGASPSGALDMAGNVWEWCATVYKPYPYTIEDEWTTAYLEGDGVRVLRGGSWYDDQMIAREAYRYDYFAHFDLFNNVGLRVASASPSS